MQSPGGVPGADGPAASCPPLDDAGACAVCKPCELEHASCRPHPSNGVTGGPKHGDTEMCGPATMPARKTEAPFFTGCRSWAASRCRRGRGEGLPSASFLAAPACAPAVQGERRAGKLVLAAASCGGRGACSQGIAAACLPSTQGSRKDLEASELTALSASSHTLGRATDDMAPPDCAHSSVALALWLSLSEQLRSTTALLNLSGLASDEEAGPRLRPRADGTAGAEVAKLAGAEVAKLTGAEAVSRNALPFTLTAPATDLFLRAARVYSLTCQQSVL